MRAKQVNVSRRLRKSLQALPTGWVARRGATAVRGRRSWRLPGALERARRAVIYASEHYSTAALETLVCKGEMPRHQHYVEIEIPAGVTYEVVTNDSLAGWYDADGAVACAFGAARFGERLSAILIVPSVVARVEGNVLIHRHHEDGGSISVGLETPVYWDLRFFAR